MTLSSHQRPVRGASDEWLTPPEIIKAVGPFDLDPCAPVVRPWAMADQHYTVRNDGLSLPWAGFVWCNPPFGPDAEKWLERLAAHGNGIGLVPARTETRWFIKTVWAVADAVLFLHGRPHFHHADGTRGKANSGAPICLIGYGDLAVQRLVRLRPAWLAGYEVEANMSELLDVRAWLTRRIEDAPTQTERLMASCARDAFDMNETLMVAIRGHRFDTVHLVEKLAERGYKPRLADQMLYDAAGLERVVTEGAASGAIPTVEQRDIGPGQSADREVSEP